MAMFAAVSRFPKGSINLPERKTKCSAGYDFEVAEDIVIPSYSAMMEQLDKKYLGLVAPDLEQVAALTKETKLKPTLVPTGIKCYMSDNQYLELSVRSSCPLKHWLILANGVGIIDADYCDNEDNEGEIFFQVINLAPFAIRLKKGDIIGQGILKNYLVMDDDAAVGERTGGFGSTSNQQPSSKETVYAYSLNGKKIAEFDVSSYDNDIQTSTLSQSALYAMPTDNNVNVNLDFSTAANAISSMGMTTEEAVDAIKSALRNLNNAFLEDIK